MTSPAPGDTLAFLIAKGLRVAITETCGHRIVRIMAHPVVIQRLVPAQHLVNVLARNQDLRACIEEWVCLPLDLLRMPQTDMEEFLRLREYLQYPAWIRGA